MFTRVVLVLTALLLGSCGGIDPDSPLGKRKALFQQMLNTSEDLGGMLHGRLRFNEEQFRDKALLLEQISREPWQYFDEPDDSAKSVARDELWEQKELFMQLARELEADTQRLVQSLEQQPLDKDFLVIRVDQVQKSCENCHQQFRVF